MEPEQKIRTIHGIANNIVSCSKITNPLIAEEIARRWAKS